MTDQETKLESIKYHCSACRTDLNEVDIMKIPIDFRKTANGKVEAVLTRYSAFCKKCQHFLFISDPVVQEELKKIAERE